MTNAVDIVRKKTIEKKKEWFDEECVNVIVEREKSRKLGCKGERVSTEIYEEMKKNKVICRKKRRHCVTGQIQELYECDKDEVKKFYWRVEYQWKVSSLVWIITEMCPCIAMDNNSFVLTWVLSALFRKINWMDWPYYVQLSPFTHSRIDIVHISISTHLNYIYMYILHSLFLKNNFQIL